MHKLFYLPLLVVCILMCSFTSQAQNTSTTPEAKELADAIRTNDITIFEAVYTNHAVTGIDEVSGLHPLHLACKMGALDFVKFMVEKEKTMETGIYVSQEEKAPMIHAIEQGHLDVIQFLLDSGSRDANGTWMGKSYLFHAIDLGATQEVKALLIRNGADPKMAAMEQKQVSDIDEINQIAEEWTTELVLQNFNLGKYQEIDVYNLNFAAGQMIVQYKEKYPNDVEGLEKGKLEILEYRNKKLFKLLNKNQRILFKQLYPNTPTGR